MGELTIEDVFDAYFDCRKCKRNSINQLRFEANLESNLVSLYRDLKSGDYQIGRSIAFVVTHPKIREIWAADFRDQVVHHVIYNAIHDRFYRRFIRDSYACIPGRGTHDGLRREIFKRTPCKTTDTQPHHFIQIRQGAMTGKSTSGVLFGTTPDRHIPAARSQTGAARRAWRWKRAPLMWRCFIAGKTKNPLQEPAFAHKIGKKTDFSPFSPC